MPQRNVATRRVSPYLTFSPLPRKAVYFSVALSVTLSRTFLLRSMVLCAVPTFLAPAFPTRDSLPESRRKNRENFNAIRVSVQIPNPYDNCRLQRPHRFPSYRHKVKEIDIPAQHDAPFRMTQALGNFGLDLFRQGDDIIAEKAVIRLRDSVGLVLEKPFTIVSDADFVVVLKSEDKVLRGFSINNADNAAHCGFLPLPRAFQLGDLHGEVDFLARGKAHEHRQQHQQRSEFDVSVCEHNDWILRFIIRFETCSAKI